VIECRRRRARENHSNEGEPVFQLVKKDKLIMKIEFLMKIIKRQNVPGMTTKISNGC